MRISIFAFRKFCSRYLKMVLSAVVCLLVILPCAPGEDRQAIENCDIEQEIQACNALVAGTFKTPGLLGMFPEMCAATRAFEADKFAQMCMSSTTEC